MSDTAGARDVVDPAAEAGYELEFEDTFDGDTLDPSRWLPHYLPQWRSREAAAARYQLGDGTLRLRIEADLVPGVRRPDQGVLPPDRRVRGPVGSSVGQSRFKPDLVVRQAQPAARLYTPQYGLFELRAKAIDDPAAWSPCG